ncbi:MAG: hypothetical protein JW797_06195 [Bradymonadales bacterium]|nr:hypothetical protein [Bradymonadales bacterium]
MPKFALSLWLSLLLSASLMACSDQDEGQPPEDDADATDTGGQSDMVPDQQEEVLPDLVEDLPVEVEPDLVEEIVPDQPDEEVVEAPLCPPEETLERERPTEGSCVALGSTTAVTNLNDNISAHLTGLAASLAFLDDSSLIVKLEELLDINQECPEEEPECTLGIDFAGAQSGAEELAGDIAQDIFHADNVEFSDGCLVTFRIPPDLLCDRNPDFPDQFCVWDEVPVRLEAWAPAAGDVYLEMMIGTSEEVSNLADFRIYQNEVAAILDLENLKETMEIISSHEEDPWEIPEVISGRIEAGLAKKGDGNYSAQLSVRTPVTFEFTIENEGTQPDDLFTFEMDPMCPILEAEINSTLEGLWFTSDIRDAEFHGPIEMMYECDPDYEECDDPEGDLGLLMDGIGAELSLDMATESILLDNITMGPTTSRITFNSQPLISVDLNAEQSRKVSLRLFMQGSEWAIQVTPALDLDIDLDLQRLVGQFSDLPEWPMDEVMSILFSGATTPALLVLDTSGPNDLDFAIKVTAGMLSLVSSYLESTLTVGTGSCLLPAPEPLDETDDQHPFETLVSGSCPD